MTTDSSAHGIAPPGFRLPVETRIGTVRLQVSDLARSLAYYERVLGFRTLNRSGGVATLGPVDGDTPILELREKAGVNPVPKRGRLGLFHFAILLPDRAALGRFLTHLGEIGAYAGMSDHLVSEALYLTDPTGLASRSTPTVHAATGATRAASSRWARCRSTRRPPGGRRSHAVVGDA